MLMTSTRTLIWAQLTACLLLVTGCVPPVAQESTWPDGPPGGRVLETEHYRLHVTTPSARFNRQLAETMERAIDQYERLAPTPTTIEQDGKLDGFVFALRDEWADHTRETTGPRAAIYLQIGRGGYAHGDSFATFLHGRPQTLAVARHEGWHQYVATRFERRPPPFLEEGLATLVEYGFIDNDMTRPRGNIGRLRELRRAVQRQRAWPLSTLLTMHAGHVVGRDGREIETFYAQAWAFARYLAEEHPRALRAMLADYAAGEADPRPARELEKHLGKPFAEISDGYEAFVRRLTATAGATR
jgi:hypothetical protein